MTLLYCKHKTMCGYMYHSQTVPVPDSCGAEVSYSKDIYIDLFYTSFCLIVCNHNGGSWYRRVEEDNLTTNISYSTNHTDFLPLVINIYLNGESIRQVICEDYTASGIVEIFFSRNCNATKVIVHMTTTAAVHLAVQLGTGNIVFCDMLNIGPQREYAHDTLCLPV